MDSLGVRVEDHFTVGIDLEKALANPGSTADIVLREGDVISIPKNNKYGYNQWRCDGSEIRFLIWKERI